MEATTTCLSWITIARPSSKYYIMVILVLHLYDVFVINNKSIENE